MKTILKRFLSINLIFCLLIFVFSLASCSSKPQKYNFIALGDSVASGYGLSSKDESYSFVFCEMLKNEGFEINEYKNLAVSGLTTTTLLEILYNMDKEDLSLVKNAQIITLNIGGNNILCPFLDYLSFESGSSEGIINNAIAAAKNVFSIPEKIFALSGNFPPELQRSLNKGVQIFEIEFREIIEWIEKNAPKATIIVNTIFL